MESPSKSFEKSAVAPPRYVDLPRALGFWGGAAIMVGIMIGGGIFRTPTTIAQHLGNPWIVLLLWLIGGVVALCGALTYAELATMFPQSGGIYVFLKEGYGRCMAFVFGWTYLLVSKPLAAGGIAIVFAEYFNPLFGVQWDPAYITCVVLLALTIINTFHIAVGAGFATFLTGLKVTALIGIIALAVLLQKGDASHFLGAPDPDPDLFAALAVVMAAIMWTYDGWSDIGAVAGEVRDPQRRIPRIFLVGTLGVTLLYIGVNAAYLWMMPLAEMAGTDTVATIVIGRIVGEVGATVTAIVVLISTLGSTHGSIITGARVSYAQARDGLLFEFLGRVHPRFHTPAISLWFQLILSCVATLYYQKFGTLIAGFIFTMWIFYGLAGIALIILRVRRPDAPRAFRVPLYPIIPIIFILSSVAMTILQAREQELADTLVWTGILIAGVPAYFLWTTLTGGRNGVMIVTDESANAPLRDNPDIDLFCLTCGYNLRGLTGDPRRCPECGANNELCELELPAGKIAAQLKKMENSLSVAALLFGASVPLFGLGLLLVSEGPAPCFFILFAAFVLFGFISLRQFQLSCGDHPGAPAAGRRYISIALGGMAIIVLPMAALSVWIQNRDWGDGFGLLILFTMVAGVLTTIAILIARPLHRRLQAIIQPMQRARAVEIVREYQRNRLLRK